MDAAPVPAASSPIAPALIPVQRRIIEWGTDGPILTAQPVLTRQHVQSLYMIVAAQPFVCEDPFDPDFAKYDGLTYAEVIVRKQIERAARSGDVDQAEKIMDRLIGKPMSRGENVMVHASYEDVLKGIEAKIKGTIIDVSAAPSEIPNLFGDLEG